MALAPTDTQSWLHFRRPSHVRRLAALLVLGLGTLSGCSGRGTYITGGPSTGQMKSSLSHLEYENDQLKTQIARLKDENKAFEDRLVQEQLHNGELAARLDDARNALRDGGSVDINADAPLSRPRTLPAGGSNTSRRRTPSAQISQASQQEEEIPPIIIDDEPPRSRSSSSSSSSSNRSRSTKPRGNDDLSIRDDDMRWTPIAHGDDDPKR